ncbi:hypothetical protein ACN28S_57330 [Cystobacter fuscus]
MKDFAPAPSEPAPAKSKPAPKPKPATSAPEQASKPDWMSDFED